MTTYLQIFHLHLKLNEFLSFCRLEGPNWFSRFSKRMAKLCEQLYGRPYKLFLHSIKRIFRNSW